jgi:hypothetical protein
MKKIAEFFKNKAGQFSSEELLKIAAGGLGLVLGAVFLFSGAIPLDKANFVIWIEGILWAYALGQGISHNVKGE